MNGSSALLLLTAGFAGGGALAAVMPSPRSARVATLVGALAGCAGGLAASAAVIASGQPIVVRLPGLVASAGGVLLELDLLGSLFLALVSSIGLLASIYGAAYMAEYDGRRSLGFFGFTFNGFPVVARPEPFSAAFGIVESWRGRIVHWVMTDDSGRLHRVKVVDPSFFNWPALAYALEGNIVPDFPLCNKSFNQSYSGNDL